MLQGGAEKSAAVAESVLVGKGMGGLGAHDPAGTCGCGCSGKRSGHDEQTVVGIKAPTIGDTLSQ
jgi:hypothetical protein